MTLLVSAPQTGLYYIIASPLQGISRLLRRLNGWMTYPKVIAFLIPGPSCYGNIILLLDYMIQNHSCGFFLIMIWLFCEVPCRPSGAHQLCPRYVKPLPAPCANMGRTSRHKQPQGWRDQGQVAGFVQDQPCWAARRSGWGSAIPSSWWEMLFSMKHKATRMYMNTSHCSLWDMARALLALADGEYSFSTAGG